MKKSVLNKINNVDNILIELEDDKKTYIVRIGNPYNEDFFYEIDKSNNDAEVQELIQCCLSYDVDEHFKLWYGANRGEPESPSSLLYNCEKIGESLEQLLQVLYNL